MKTPRKVTFENFLSVCANNRVPAAPNTVRMGLKDEEGGRKVGRWEGS